jgi:hypothetical protein
MALLGPTKLLAHRGQRIWQVGLSIAPGVGTRKRPVAERRKNSRRSPTSRGHVNCHQQRYEVLPFP